MLTDTHKITHKHQSETRSDSLLAFKTKVLIIITHMHTNVELGWAGVGAPAGPRQRDTPTPRRSLYCRCHGNQGQVV